MGFFCGAGRNFYIRWKSFIENGAGLHNQNPHFFIDFNDVFQCVCGFHGGCKHQQQRPHTFHVFIVTSGSTRDVVPNSQALTRLLVKVPQTYSYSNYNSVLRTSTNKIFTSMFTQRVRNSKITPPYHHHFRLYRCLELEIFQGLAQEVLNACTGSLQLASSLISERKGTLLCIYILGLIWGF